MTLILASQSPRRAQLLDMLGLTFETLPADIDETHPAGEAADAHAERLAREKAQAIAARRPEATVIGSDTVVVVDGQLLSKPRDDDDAVRMLLRLAGREHTVATGIAVAHAGAVHSAVELVSVTFRYFDETTAMRYVATREPMDKAGAYGIQGFGATLVERISGDYFAVMGLPVCRMVMLLEEAGLQYDFSGRLRGVGDRAR
ncbi:MAG: Maf family protein [Gemmatimonadota bacterium]